MKIKGAFSHSKTGSRIIQLIGVALFFMLVFSLLSVWITKGDFSDIKALKLAQFFQSLGLFVIPPFILAYLWSEEPLGYLRINRNPSGEYVLFAVIVMLVAIPAINLLGELNHAIPFPDSLSSLENYLVDMEKRAEDLTIRMLDVNSVGGLLVNIGLIAIIPAVGEELFFRGIIQQVLQTNLKSHAAVWITAIIFSTIHFQFFGFIPRVLMGAFLGYLLVWTKNMWVPIIAHFANNATAVLFYYFKGEGNTFDIDNIGKSDTYLIGIISLIAVLLLIYLFRKRQMASEAME
ncbi:MAG TPA: type II CAAX endopeptidase family protein [Paludibacter sp.]|nr:type II CAAX endopeptidase family protein [Paludibacter sp.]HOS46746.1 type II CAAX endopeptidase family protein [Paludibacter sp.]HPM10877.1 type II CAAX endopeptidase family protein [Paludibacter sp.]